MRIKDHRIFRIGHAGVFTVAAVFNILVFLWLVVSAYGGMIPPSYSVIGALAAMTFPFALVFNILFLVVNLFIFRRLVVVNVLGLIACIGPLLTYCPLNLPIGDRDDNGTKERFSLLSYNILAWHYYRDSYEYGTPNLTMGFILEKDPDIVCLQECPDLSPLRRWMFDKEQFDSISSRYPYKLTDIYGLTLLSKYPAYRVATDRSAITRGFESDFDCYRLSVEGHKLYIFNVHLQSIGLTTDDKELYRRILSSPDKSQIEEARRQLVGKLAEAFRLRQIQARALRANIDSIAGADNNVIVCGDYNDIPGCYATRLTRGHDMTDAFAHAGFGPSITYYGNRFYFRIDHMFYRGDLDCISIEREKIRTSDHYPLFAVFEWD